MRSGTAMQTLAVLAVVGLASVATGLASAPATRGTPTPGMGLSCAIEADSTLRAGQGEASVIVRYSEEIGELLDAQFPKGANITATSVARGPDAPLSARITANTIGAVTGQWELTLNGDGGWCAGKVWVGYGEPDRGLEP